MSPEERKRTAEHEERRVKYVEQALAIELRRGWINIPMTDVTFDLVPPEYIQLQLAAEDLGCTVGELVRNSIRATMDGIFGGPG